MQRFRTGAGKAEADALPPCSCTSDGSRPPPLAPPELFAAGRSTCWPQSRRPRWLLLYRNSIEERYLRIELRETNSIESHCGPSIHVHSKDPFLLLSSPQCSQTPPPVQTPAPPTARCEQLSMTLRFS